MFLALHWCFSDMQGATVALPESNCDPLMDEISFLF